MQSMLRYCTTSAARLCARHAIPSTRLTRRLTSSLETQHKTTNKEIMRFYSNLENTAQRNGDSYILNVKCGRTVQHEPIRDGGYNLLSVMTFANDDDRRFFVTHDPAHLALKEMVTGKMDKTQMVLDFVSGE